MDDLLTEFLTETVESLDNLDVEIVQLEQNPNDPELLGNIFRLVHTIKGTCGFIGLTRLESVAHAGENVLGNFREGIQEVTPEAVSLILAALDRIKEIVAVLEETEAEPAGDDKELIAQLDAMYRAGKEGTAPTAAEPADAASADAESSAAEPAVVAEAPQNVPALPPRSMPRSSSCTARSWPTRNSRRYSKASKWPGCRVIQLNTSSKPSAVPTTISTMH